MGKLKLSGAAVLLIIVVPVLMYAGALLIGVQLGRALERRPDSDSVSFSIGGALTYVAKELWDTNNIFGRRQDRDHEWVLLPVRDESSSDDTDRYSKAAAGSLIPLKWADDEDSSGNSATSLSKAPPQAQRFHSNQYADADGRDTEDARFVTENPPSHRRGRTKHRGSPCGDDDGMVEKLTTPSNKTKRHHSNHTSQPGGVMSVGPWGGSGGQPFYMRGSSAPRLRSIVLQHSSSGVHSLACYYSGGGDDRGIRRAGPWGRPHNFDSTRLIGATIRLSAGEHLTAVEGTTGHFSNNIAGAVVTSLVFRTSTGRTYGPYGSTASTGITPFSVPAADGACIVGFWGRSGWLIDAIGVYIKPSCSSSSSSSSSSL